MIKKPKDLLVFRRTQDDVEIEEDGHTKMSISSTDPYLRWMDIPDEGFVLGYEILSHKKNDVKLSRLENGAPLLFNHNRDIPIGKIESVERTDEKLTVDVRFSKNNPDAQWIEPDVKDELLTKTSISYSPGTYREIAKIGDIRAFENVGWEPSEASIVTVPADDTVGVEKMLYRDLQLSPTDEEHRELVQEILKSQEKEVTVTGDGLKVVVNGDDFTEYLTQALKQDSSILIDNQSESESKDSAWNDNEESKMSDKKVEQTAPEEKPVVSAGVDLDAARRDAGAIAEFLSDNGAGHLAGEFISKGYTIEKAKAELWDRQKTERKVDTVREYDHQETKELDLNKAIRALVENDRSELHEEGMEVARSFGIRPEVGALYVPLNLKISRDHPLVSYVSSQRAFASTVSDGGASFVTQEYMTFKDALFANTPIDFLGVEQTDGHTAQLNYPGISGSMPVTWVGENSAVSAASGTLRNTQLLPNQIVGWVPVSKFLSEVYDGGSYDPNTILQRDIMKSLRSGLNTAFCQGGGGNAPSGLLNAALPAVGAVSASTALYSTLTEKVEGNFGDVGVFLVGSDVYHFGKDNVWASGGSDKSILTGDLSGKAHAMSEYGPVYYTQHMPALSAVYGDFSDAVVATFGVMQFVIDPSVARSTGQNVLAGTLYADVGFPRPQSFGVASASVNLSVT